MLQDELSQLYFAQSIPLHHVSISDKFIEIFVLRVGVHAGEAETIGLVGSQEYIVVFHVLHGVYVVHGIAQEELILHFNSHQSHVANVVVFAVLVQ